METLICAEKLESWRVKNDAENYSDDRVMDFLDTNYDTEYVLQNSEPLLPVY
jgi:hypothetical protein